MSGAEAAAAHSCDEPGADGGLVSWKRLCFCQKEMPRCTWGASALPGKGRGHASCDVHRHHPTQRQLLSPTGTETPRLSLGPEPAVESPGHPASARGRLTPVPRPSPHPSPQGTLPAHHLLKQSTALPSVDTCESHTGPRTMPRHGTA